MTELYIRSPDTGVLYMVEDAPHYQSAWIWARFDGWWTLVRLATEHDLRKMQRWMKFEMNAENN